MSSIFGYALKKVESDCLQLFLVLCGAAYIPNKFNTCLINTLCLFMRYWPSIAALFGVCSTRHHP